MLETKSLLEQKAASLTARADSVDELQAEIAAMRVQIDSLNQVGTSSVSGTKTVRTKSTNICKVPLLLTGEPSTPVKTLASVLGSIPFFFLEERAWDRG